MCPQIHRRLVKLGLRIPKRAPKQKPIAEADDFDRLMREDDMLEESEQQRIGGTLQLFIIIMIAYGRVRIE